MKNNILVLILSIFCSSTIYSQITITTPPSNANDHCENGVAIENHSRYLAWLSKNGGGQANSNCNGTITWAITQTDYNYNYGCTGGNIDVEWEISDNCSNQTATAYSMK